MKLYYSPGACSLAPHIVLREAGLDHALVKVNTKAKQTADGRNYLDINPKGYVPALELDDGQVLTEAAVLVQYLADRAPVPGLAPAPGSADRYRLQEWLNFIATELHKGHGVLWYPNIPDDEKNRAREKLAARYDHLSTHLAGREWLLGRYSVADAYLFTILNWAQWTGIDLSRWPVLQQYHARVAARPQVQQALKAEGLVKS
jgi:glutathione S-transferase